MAGKVNPPVTAPAAMARVTIAATSTGIGINVENEGIPDHVFAASLQSVVDEINGKTDRATGLF